MARSCVECLRVLFAASALAGCQTTPSDAALQSPECPNTSGFRFTDLLDPGKQGVYDRTVPSSALIMPFTDRCSIAAADLLFLMRSSLTSPDNLFVVTEIAKRSNQGEIISLRGMNFTVPRRGAHRFTARWSGSTISGVFVDGRAANP